MARVDQHTTTTQSTDSDQAQGTVKFHLAPGAGPVRERLTVTVQMLGKRDDGKVMPGPTLRNTLQELLDDATLSAAQVTGLLALLKALADKSLV